MSKSVTESPAPAADAAPVAPVAPQRAFPLHLSAPVACPLPGYAAVRLRYVVSVTQNEIAATPDLNALCALLVHDFSGWAFGPAPAAADDWRAVPLTFRNWAYTQGWQEALASSLDPN